MRCLPLMTTPHIGESRLAPGLHPRQLASPMTTSSSLLPISAEEMEAEAEAEAAKPKKVARKAAARLAG